MAGGGGVVLAGLNGVVVRADVKRGGRGGGAEFPDLYRKQDLGQGQGQIALPEGDDGLVFPEGIARICWKKPDFGRCIKPIPKRPMACPSRPCKRGLCPCPAGRLAGRGCGVIWRECRWPIRLGWPPATTKTPKLLRL